MKDKDLSRIIEQMRKDFRILFVHRPTWIDRIKGWIKRRKK